ncbi:hypothetical protein [Oceanibacterium hippocampi]|uniref:Phage virion morphogenesis family protein n=1 Tax=Oceanibacterium hippocampi TaxID=745714 RepID=A0A1Y5TZL2_9PROT|nr:hypothetical protein [Oceanibacterium hippocampi]SLN77571.1 hypothetical protein OCH7691_04463 [Oceanibacterium hippocampi]
MAVEVNIDTDLAALRRFLGDVETRQLPFAAALGLTGTAKAINEDARGSLADRFTIRSSWVGRGLQVNPASKRDPLSRMQAEAGTRDAFMARQELGGTKEPKGGRSRVAIPLAIRRTPEEKTTRAKWPGRLLAKKTGRRKPFLTTAVRGPSKGQGIIARRVEGERYPLQVLYRFTPKLPVAPRWGFVDRGARTAEAVYFDKVNEALDRAVATAIDRHKPRR